MPEFSDSGTFWQSPMWVGHNLSCVPTRQYEMVHVLSRSMTLHMLLIDFPLFSAQVTEKSLAFENALSREITVVAKKEAGTFRIRECYRVRLTTSRPRSR